MSRKRNLSPLALLFLFAATAHAASTSPTITSPLTAMGIVGDYFTYQITGTNTPTSFGANNLPLGLQFNATTGMIFGTPEVGTESLPVGISVSNINGSAQGTLYLTITDDILPPPPEIVSPRQATIFQGSYFSYHIEATNSPTDYNATGFPPWMHLDPNGVISGVVVNPEPALPIGLSASNAGGTGTATLKLTVLPRFPILTPTSFMTLLNYPLNLQLLAKSAPGTNFVVSDLPTGVTTSESTLVGTPTVPGVYVIHVTATNGTQSDSQTFVLTVVDPADVTDTDGDGFSDRLEQFAASDPLNAASTPLGIPAGPPTALSLTGLSVHLNFAQANADSLTLTGTLPAPADFAPAGQNVLVAVGGVMLRFQLNSSGMAQLPHGTGLFKLFLKPSAQPARFALTLTKSALAADLAGEGLSVQTIRAQLCPVLVDVLFNGAHFQATRIVSYAAKAGKSGNAR